MTVIQGIATLLTGPCHHKTKQGFIVVLFNSVTCIFQGYYNLTSDMGTELMVKIAEENLQETELSIKEEVHRRNSLKVFHIWICR